MYIFLSLDRTQLEHIFPSAQWKPVGDCVQFSPKEVHLCLCGSSIEVSGSPCINYSIIFISQTHYVFHKMNTENWMNKNDHFMAFLHWSSWITIITKSNKLWERLSWELCCIAYSYILMCDDMLGMMIIISYSVWTLFDTVICIVGNVENFSEMSMCMKCNAHSHHNTSQHVTFTSSHIYFDYPICNLKPYK